MSKQGPKLTYASSGTPTREVLVEVDEVGNGGYVFTLYVPVEISGKYAERTAAELEGRDEIQVSGKLPYRRPLIRKAKRKRASRSCRLGCHATHRDPSAREHNGNLEGDLDA